MPRNFVIPTTPSHIRRRLAVGEFKVCQLCGTLNVRQNCECFVCRWHGEFDTNSALVEIKLYELLDRCPELTDVMYEHQSERIGFWKALSEAILAPFRRRIDLQV